MNEQGKGTGAAARNNSRSGPARGPRLLELLAVLPAWVALLALPVIRSWPAAGGRMSVVISLGTLLALTIAAALWPRQGLVGLIIGIGLFGYLRLATPLGAT